MADLLLKPLIQSLFDVRADPLDDRRSRIFSDVLLHDVSVFSDEDVGWQRVSSVLAHHLVACVVALRPGHAVLGYEVAPIALIVVLIDTDYLELPTAVDRGQLLQAG